MAQCINSGQTLPAVIGLLVEVPVKNCSLLAKSKPFSGPNETAIAD
jgi:hypothetical protein